MAGLPEVMRPFGRRVLLTYGGGSIKRIGLYDRVRELLKDFEIFELGGIEPNPKYSTSVVEGVRICKEQQIDVILSVGGGSVLDCSKAIAGGAKYDGETWDLITGKAPTLAALPIVDILTLAATGSEYDAGGVISRTETNDKIAYIDPHLFPACSFLDPTYTFIDQKAVDQIHNGQDDEQLPEARRKAVRTIYPIDTDQYIGDVAGNTDSFENQSVSLYFFVCCKSQLHAPILNFRAVKMHHPYRTLADAPSADQNQQSPQPKTLQNRL